MRIKKQFEQLKSEGRKGLVTYIMAYDPNVKESYTLLESLPKAGADIIELGMPFSDPAADGPTIQAAGNRALKAKVTLDGILKLVHDFRRQDNKTPIILMGYYNPIYHYGVERFVDAAKTAGVDGLLLVDLPPEEDDKTLALCDDRGIDLIKLVAPTTTEQRLKTILPKARGFIYYVSVTGITGTKSAVAVTVKEAAARIRHHSTLPIVAGFGIKTPTDVKAIAPYVEAVVVGSALIEQLVMSGTKMALKFVTSLRKAL